MALVIKVLDNERKKAVEAKAIEQGGIDQIKADFAAATTVPQLKAVLKKIFKVSGILEKGD